MTSRSRHDMSKITVQVLSYNKRTHDRRAGAERRQLTQGRVAPPTVLLDVDRHAVAAGELLVLEPRDLASKLSDVDTGHLEPRWPASVALVVCVTLYVLLPDRLVVGPHWLLPVLVALPLGPLSARRHRHPDESVWIRHAVIGLVALVTARQRRVDGACSCTTSWSARSRRVES